MQQLSLFSDSDIQVKNKFPSTRYQGGKAKFVDWIWHEISHIPFRTVLDAFGGTGSVAYKLKDKGKSVTYNDILIFNSIIGKAIIENKSVILSDLEVDQIIEERKDIEYPSFIADNFKDIYYTDDENHWLDVVRYNISTINNEYKRAIAWFALFQSCIITIVR
ncbi:MAG: DNA adenine methylase [Pseudoflavonifractor sp.]|nr:DNA adenine methylase [Alloprevotella sp.]MCM1116764.1 DNA adenine methylase [Pseudoflavonifractor sp.]